MCTKTDFSDASCNFLFNYFYVNDIVINLVDASAFLIS